MNIMINYKDIEDIAEEHSIKDLGRISHAYQCGFTQGANYQKKIDIDKACEWLKKVNGKRFNGFDIVYTNYFIEEFRKAMEE